MNGKKTAKITTMLTEHYRFNKYHFKTFELYHNEFLITIFEVMNGTPPLIHEINNG